jgi:hypothetical protein
MACGIGWRLSILRILQRRMDVTLCLPFHHVYKQMLIALYSSRLRGDYKLRQMRLEYLRANAYPG